MPGALKQRMPNREAWPGRTESPQRTQAYSVHPLKLPKSSVAETTTGARSASRGESCDLRGAQVCETCCSEQTARLSSLQPCMHSITPDLCSPSLYMYVHMYINYMSAALFPHIYIYIYICTYIYMYTYIYIYGLFRKAVGCTMALDFARQGAWARKPPHTPLATCSPQGHRFLYV